LLLVTHFDLKELRSTSSKNQGQELTALPLNSE